MPQRKLATQYRSCVWNLGLCSRTSRELQEQDLSSRPYSPDVKPLHSQQVDSIEQLNMLQDPNMGKEMKHDFADKEKYLWAWGTNEMGAIKTVSLIARESCIVLQIAPVLRGTSFSWWTYALLPRFSWALELARCWVLPWQKNLIPCVLQLWSSIKHHRPDSGNCTMKIRVTSTVARSCWSGSWVRWKQLYLQHWAL